MSLGSVFIPRSIGDPIKIAGDQFIKLDPTEVLHDPRRGVCYRQRIWAPANQPSLINVMRLVQSQGGSGKFVADGPDPYYEYEMPGLPDALIGVIPELFFDTWDLVANESSDTIFNNPLLQARWSALPGDRDILSLMATKGLSLSEAIDQRNDPANDGQWHTLTADWSAAGYATQLAMEIVKGQTEFEHPRHVLTHVSVCAPWSYYNSTRANTMKIYSPGHLLSEVSSGWTYNLPTRLFSEIASIPQEFASTDESPYYTWGWLKKITRSSPQTNFMVEVSTEYICGLWPNLRYDLAG